MKKVFLTYCNNKEKAIALRAQTLSNLYGYILNLPVRSEQNRLTDETAYRIKKSDFFIGIWLSTSGRMCKALEEEITYAKDCSKPVLLIRNEGAKKSLAKISI